LNISVIAQRYASALWGVTDTADKAATFSVLNGLLEAIWHHDDAKRLLLNPAVAANAKIEIVDECLTSLSGSDATKLFFKELISKGRFEVFDQIVAAFEQKLMAENNCQKAKVTTAIALEEADCQRLRKQLEAKVGSAVDLEQVVDPQILGGMIVEIGGKLLDLSVKTKLSSFQSHLESE